MGFGYGGASILNELQIGLYAGDLIFTVLKPANQSFYSKQSWQ